MARNADRRCILNGTYSLVKIENYFNLWFVLCADNLCCVLIIKVSIGLFYCQKCSFPTGAKCLCHVPILSLISMHQTQWFSETKANRNTFYESNTFNVPKKRPSESVSLYFSHAPL